MIHHTGNSKGKFKGKAKIIDSKGNYKIVFPSGATIEFSYLTCEKDAIENWQGAELTAAIFDEFTHFDEPSFNYIRTRMRSKSKYPSFIRCSMNPSPVHFVKDKYLDGFIIKDENHPKYGCLDRELNGKPRYYVFDRGEINTSWDKEELQVKFPNSKPRKYTAVSSSITDNPAMLEHNPEYADDLQANDPANAAMLLDGNWMYQPAANGFWDRSTVTEILENDLPEGIRSVRGWDKASTEPSKESSGYDPDYTASVKIGRCPQGDYYVFGDYITDDEGQQIGRFRKKPGPRDNLISKQAELDGDNVPVILAKDPAQSGEVEYTMSAKRLSDEGFTVYKDPVPSNKSKYKRFEPFCAASHNNFVYFVCDTFDRKLLDYLYLELENFDGDKNNGYKDDMLDALSSAFNYLSKVKPHQPALFTSISSPTLISGVNTRDY